MAKTVYTTGQVPTATDFNALTQEANAAITGGTINGALIGGVTPSAGLFTSIAGQSLAVTAAGATDTAVFAAGASTPGYIYNGSSILGFGTTSALGGIYTGLYMVPGVSFNVKVNGSTIATLSTTALAITGGISATGTISPQQAATASAPAYVKGAIYFDTTLNKLRVGGATAWETITSV
jgi:hypothetical protein